jgi:hypothetical protein
MSRNTRRSFLRLETFDDRCLPSVTAGMVPGSTILQITGDAASDNLTIDDSGQSGGVTVTVNGASLGTFTDRITSIVVDMGDGVDVVTYNLNAPMVASRIVDVHLGKGNDSFTANLSNQGLGQFNSLDISAYGEGGADSMTLNALNFSSEQGSILNVDYVGGAGKDGIKFNYSPGLVDLGSILLQKDQRH